MKTGYTQPAEKSIKIVRMEEFKSTLVDTKLEMIRALIPVGLMAVSEMLEQEVIEWVGQRYQHQPQRRRRSRYGSNPGSVRVGGIKQPRAIPRVRDLRRNREIRLQSVDRLKEQGQVNELLLRRVLYGIPCRNYESAALEVPGALGLFASSVSREFIEATRSRLREFQQRDLSGYDFVAMVLDGKTFQEDTMVIGLGITLEGEKILLGFVQSETENERSLMLFLKGLLDRGLSLENGLLVVIDGGKGLRASVKKVFKDRALIQRCQWHKRENVVSYLAQKEQPYWRARFNQAYSRPSYEEAKQSLLSIRRELEQENL